MSGNGDEGRHDDVHRRLQIVSVIAPPGSVEAIILTDEWGGYCGLLNRMTVCHAHGFVNPSALKPPCNCRYPRPKCISDFAGTVDNKLMNEE